MEIQQDFSELLRSFNAKKVEYLVVGGYALAFHGAPRATGDLDILVKPDAENAAKILAALKDFGFGGMKLGAEDFTSEDKVLQIGVPPVRIDIVTSITGVSWKDAFAGKAAGLYGDVPVFYIGKKQFAANKKAVGRRKDLADLEAIGEDAPQ